MNELWNNPDIKSPPIISIINKNISSELSQQFAIILKQTDHLEKYLNILKVEWNLIQSVIKKVKRSFRNNHGFHKIQQVDQALNYLYKLDMLTFLKHFKNSTVLNNIKISDYYPSKQMLQYLLLRFQTIAKLLDRICSLSFSAGRMFNGIIEIGFVQGTSVTLFALISRIWYISKYLYNEIIVWYNHLHRFIHHLPSANTKWLPKNYRFPYDLRKWIDNDPTAFEAPDSIPVFTIDEEISLIDVLSDNDNLSGDDCDDIKIVNVLFNQKSPIELSSDDDSDSKTSIINID